MRRLSAASLVGVMLAVTACGGDANDGEREGTGGAAGAGGSAGSGGSSSEVPGCTPDVRLLAKSADPAEPGPWAVGVRTAQVGKLTAEVWYPATPGSDAGKQGKVYDLREWLPTSEKAKIPDADNPWQRSHSFADLPLDADHGPYPVVIFVHGTAGFRTQSLEHMEHWASRGFVVLAADHPGLFLGDLLDFDTAERDLDGDLNALVSAAKQASGDLAFLNGRADTARVAMAGHSAGGGAVQARGADAAVLMPLAAGGTKAGAKLVSTLVMAGQADKVVAYADTVKGYDASPKKKRLLGVAKAGHLFPSALCWLENDGGANIFEVAQQYGVKNASLAGLLFDCPADQPGPTELRAVVNFATAATLEETLHCTLGDPFGDVKERFPQVGEFRYEP
jgi:alpha-beta hydrolase superfamily lysophospholipase